MRQSFFLRRPLLPPVILTTTPSGSSSSVDDPVSYIFQVPVSFFFGTFEIFSFFFVQNPVYFVLFMNFRDRQERKQPFNILNLTTLRLNLGHDEEGL